MTRGRLVLASILVATLTATVGTAAADHRKPKKPKPPKPPVITCVDVVTWAPTRVDRFAVPGALSRNRGVALSAGTWFFASQYGVSRTVTSETNGQRSYSDSKAAPLAIPPDLLLAGSDRIGDVDLYGRVLVAPVEDSGRYRHPYLIYYDVDTLRAIGRYALPSDQVTQGVPWVAIDEARGLAIVPQWQPSYVLNVFDLTRPQWLSHQLRLDRFVGTIRGAQVSGDTIYAAVDGPKSVVAINLYTGHVSDVVGVNTPGTVTALAHGATPDGELHVLVNEGTTLSAGPATSLHHFRRTVSRRCTIS